MQSGMLRLGKGRGRGEGRSEGCHGSTEGLIAHVIRLLSKNKKDDEECDWVLLEGNR